MANLPAEESTQAPHMPDILSTTLNPILALSRVGSGLNCWVPRRSQEGRQDTGVGERGEGAAGLRSGGKKLNSQQLPGLLGLALKPDPNPGVGQGPAESRLAE